MTEAYEVGALVRVAQPDHYITAFAKRIAGRTGAIDGVIGTALRPSERRYRIRFPRDGRKPEFLTSFDFNARDLLAASQEGAQK